MSTSVIKFYPKRSLSDAQLARLNGHKPSIVVDANGNVSTTVRTIITPAGNVKEVKYKTIRPGSTERVVSTTDVPELFADLKHINVILTNACNLSCSYCYEQHSHDYGRFTPETLKQIYDFQLHSNTEDGKMFQFFGGEPLIHKQLILDFINKYAEELAANEVQQHVGMITNGILLTPEFIQSYFSHNFVSMSISLDTDDAAIDHREIGQEKIDHIIKMVSLIPEYHKKNHAVCIRCTIAIENAPQLRNFAHRLYTEAGVRSMVIHPLTMSSVNGFMSWPEDMWAQLHRDIVGVIETYPDFTIQFSEGVGIRGGNNCMVGSDMIAVDGSGDYSGCYFFTNQKEGVPHTILGNLLERVVYVDRYTTFQEQYDAMFETEEQCKTCDLQDLCYQCPAGNLDAHGGKMFRPDDMCQKIVRLFITLQDDITKKAFFQKMVNVTNTVAVIGEQRTFAKAIVHLMYRYLTGHHLPVGTIDGRVDDLPNYEQLLGYVLENVESSPTVPSDVDQLISSAGKCQTRVNAKTFYERFQAVRGRPTQVSSSAGDISGDINKRIFYLVMIHMLILNPKGDILEHKQKE